MTNEGDRYAGPGQWPDGGTESVPCCPICGSGDRHALHTELSDQVFYCAPGTWDLYQCSQCRCAYLDPRPTQDTIHLAYRDYYTHTPPVTYDTNSFKGLRRFKYALGNGYRNWRFGTNSTPASKLGPIATWLIPGKRRAWETDFRNLPRPSPGASLLDVGFGDGSFLELAQSAGWRVAGADADPVAVEAALKRGLSVRLGFIDAFADMPASFDVITLSHVIEHVHDPKRLTTQVYGLLKPGGIVWIDTPNIDSYGHRRFGRHWRGLEPPRHLVIFNWKALESVLRAEGFSDLRRLTRHDVYGHVAVNSHAIRNGWRPDKRPAPDLFERMTNAFLALGSRLNYRHSEFVTLVAKKPF